MNFVSHQTIEAKPIMTGKDLAERLAQMRPDARAVLALSFTRDVTLARLTRMQTARLTVVPPYNVALAGLATPTERAGLLCGDLTLRDVRAAHAKYRQPSDDDVVITLHRIGIDRVWAALDAMTAPQSIAAE